MVLNVKIRAVGLVIASFAGAMDCPEIVEHMRVDLQSLTGLCVDMPDPNAVCFRHQAVADLSMARPIYELLGQFKRFAHWSTSAQKTKSVAQSMGIEGLE